MALAVAVVLALMGASPVGSTPVTADPRPRPNIIFFLVDDMSADLLPYMDTVRGLADGGIAFSDYYVSDSLCCPSRASMFTGEFPHNTGVRTNQGYDRGGHRAFAEHEGRTYAVALRGAGYRTGYLGKYINEYPARPGYRVPPGWDEWHVSASGGYDEFSYQLTRYIREESGARRPITDSKGGYLVDVLGRRAVSFVERSREHAPGRPFFLQVSTFSPHNRVDVEPGDTEPRFPPAPRDRPKDRFPAGEFPHGDCGGPDCAGIDVTGLPAFDEDTRDKPAWVRRQPIGPKRLRELREDFRDRIRMVQSVDDMVARVLAALTAGERRNTYVVFASDNGFHLGQHGLGRGKGTPYDSDVHVPLLVTGPGVVPGSRTEVVSNIDLAS
ncbi:MAG TPA: sulfatase, partial [Nonomuraea sp.]|nr:sulfatase [Nonomuraea sp.]